jgi:hypothetical protein
MQISGWLTATAFGLALAAAPLAAQDAAAQLAAGADRKGEQKMTITGCVERADQVLSRENLGTTVDSLTYVLVKTEAGPVQSQPAAPQAGADQNGIGKAYRLDVDRDTMNPHVGHRVEVVGWTMAAADAAVGTSGRAASPAPGEIGAQSPVFKVESVKMLSSTCGR